MTEAKKLCREMKWFWSKRLYVICLVLTAVCSYGFAIAEPSIGIDDTAVELYLEEGLEVVMGRWTVFLLNKLFHMSEFAPFMLELVGVIFLALSATVFCVLLKRLFGEGIGVGGYTVFSCVLLSSPIISEVFIYYYHDGVGLGYMLTALGLIAFSEALDKKGRQRVVSCFVSMLFVWAAVGCYESFLILYIVGILSIVFMKGFSGKRKMSTGFVLGSLGVGALLTAGSVLLRTLMIPLMTALFGLGNMEGLMNQRSLSEMLVLFQGREGFENLLMLAKRFFLVYHVNAAVYLPVTVYVFGNCCMGGLSLFLAAKRRNLWYPVLFLGMLFAPFLLTIAEARVTHYRSCQYLPFAAALGVLFFFCLLCQGKGRGVRRYLRPVAWLLAGILVFNQASAMNRSFYTDYKKYESTKETLSQVAFELEKNYSGMPVVFTGHYDTPQVFLEDYCVSYSSPQYRMIAGITDLVDEHLKEKYFTPYGYSFVGEAGFPFIQWGLDAFDGTNGQMIKFMEMHGHSFQTVTDEAILQRARETAAAMPRWPKEGSVVPQEGYVIVNF